MVARNSVLAPASRTVFAAMTRSMSEGAAAISGDGEHLDVAQGGHRVGDEILVGYAGAREERLAQVVGEDLVLEVHGRIQPVLRDRVEVRARGFARAARADRLEIV